MSLIPARVANMRMRSSKVFWGIRWRNFFPVKMPRARTGVRYRLVTMVSVVIRFSWALSGSLMRFAIRKKRAHTPISSIFGRRMVRKYSWNMGPAALASTVAIPPDVAEA